MRRGRHGCNVSHVDSGMTGRILEKVQRAAALIHLQLVTCNVSLSVGNCICLNNALHSHPVHIYLMLNGKECVWMYARQLRINERFRSVQKYVFLLSDVSVREAL